MNPKISIVTGKTINQSVQPSKMPQPAVLRFTLGIKTPSHKATTVEKKAKKKYK